MSFWSALFCLHVLCIVYKRCSLSGHGCVCLCLCVSVKTWPLCYLCPSAAVISAHPIHSLDNHRHYCHLSSMASPNHSYLQHTSSPRPLTSSISYLDRAESPGEPAAPAESVKKTLHPCRRSLCRLCVHYGAFDWVRNKSISFQSSYAVEVSRLDNIIMIIDMINYITVQLSLISYIM